MSSISALITYHHDTAGFLVKETWFQDIEKGNYATWKGLSVDLARWHYPNAEETVLGMTSQKRKNIRSTKKHITKDNKSNQPNLNTTFNKYKEAHFFIIHSSKTHSDRMGKFTHIVRSSNQCLMIACVVDANLILAAPFKTNTKRQLTATYLKIENELGKRGIAINMHVLDNEAPELHKDATEHSKCSYQLVPPNDHRRNASERAIRTFKEHFLRILTGLHKQFPLSMWDHLIEKQS